MKRRTATVILQIMAVVLMIALINCSEEESPVEVTPGVKRIMPLKVGNTWTYVDSVYQGGSQPGAFTSRISVTGQTVLTVDSVLYDAFVVESIDSLYLETTIQYMQNDKLNGLWNFGVVCSGDSLMVRHLYARYPVSPGDGFVTYFFQCFTGTPLGFGPGTAVCTHTDTSYTTPAGTFSCIRYRAHYSMPVFGEFDIYNFMAPGIGLVGQELIAPTGVVKKRLKSYSLR